MRFEILPLTAILDDVELVVSAVRESKEVLLTELGDVHVAAHGEIDQRRGDVLHVRLVVDERAELGGRRAGEGLVADDVRSFLWIAPLLVPVTIGENQDD